MGIGSLNGADRSTAKPDYLVTVPLQEGMAATYQNLWQKKLLVTPGEVARFVHLPGLIGEETAVSVYQIRNSSGATTRYGITVTQASRRLWNCVPGSGVEHPVDADKIRIERKDLPMPQSTAMAVRKLWLAMLALKRDGMRTASLDVSTELYSALDANGRLVIGRAASNAPSSGAVTRLLEVANLMIEYCDASVADRSATSLKIKKKASALLMDVTPPRH